MIVSYSIASSIKEWKNLAILLDQYKKAYGETLNLQKSHIFFSKNTSTIMQQKIMEESGAKKSGDFEKHLGLLSMVGQSRYRAFKGLKERVWKKVHNWENYFLSQARKEVLVKAIIQSISTYTMSVFKLPRRLCKEINKIMSNFWWEHMKQDRKIQWMEVE